MIHTHILHSGTKIRTGSFSHSSVPTSNASKACRSQIPPLISFTPFTSTKAGLNYPLWGKVSCLQLSSKPGTTWFVDFLDYLAVHGEQLSWAKASHSQTPATQKVPKTGLSRSCWWLTSIMLILSGSNMMGSILERTALPSLLSVQLPCPLLHTRGKRCYGQKHHNGHNWDFLCCSPTCCQSWGEGFLFGCSASHCLNLSQKESPSNRWPGAVYTHNVNVSNISRPFIKTQQALQGQESGSQFHTSFPARSFHSWLVIAGGGNKSQ